MLETIGRVLIFFALIGLGAVLVKLKRLNSQGLDGLSAYFYWLGFPAFLISHFSQMDRPDADMAMAISAYAVAMIVSAGICIALVRVLKSPASEASAVGMASYINNSAFLGIPVAISLFGPEAAHIGPFFVAVDFMLLFSLGCAGLAWSSGHRVRTALKHTALNPTVIASAFGLMLMFTGIHFPPAVQTGIDFLGQSGPPVALVALGGMLGMMPEKTLFGAQKAAIVAVLGKTIFAPALVALALYLVHADPLIFKVGVLLAACPTAVSVFIQTKIYNVWYEGAAIAISQSAALSLVTLSVLALILTHF